MNRGLQSADWGMAKRSTGMIGPGTLSPQPLIPRVGGLGGGGFLRFGIGFQ